MTPEIETVERMEEHTPTTRVHYCGTTNVVPAIFTRCVLPLNQEPSATLIELHHREVRYLAAGEIAAGRAHFSP